ncbi:16S rRNA (cytosine(1402)-N(4))-methyltransferase RsmH [Flavobacteriaceae bacterium Ap0902]|nr:16S rRNA (cytosine(1402)-N(4))-methyltransferase RsmH [Flavobacteriaceae bacterium Ap0902]
MEYHKPVLLDKSVEALITDPNGTYVDVTFGGGGHAREILNHLGEHGKLIAFDQDPDAYQNEIKDDRFHLVMSNFRFLKNQLRFLGIKEIDGLLGDLGVSSFQFDTAERGFSTRFKGELDMRMNQNQTKSAKTVINEYEETDLARIFKEYGELRSARKWANKIVHERKTNPIETTTDLTNLFKNQIQENRRNKIFALLFQALRIEVNDELDALKELLVQSAEVIKPEGRLVVISYHSLEDRLVKRFIKTGLFEGEPERDMFGNWYAPFQPSQSKVITADEQEIDLNPRARSAKLRIGIRNGEEKKN